VSDYTAKDVARFWEKVDCTAGFFECWTWKAFCNQKGYGMLWWLGKSDRAHRVAWTLTNGAIPDAICVLHSCDNPPCCNPSHLFLGTNLENTQDRVSKGRNGDISGEKHPRHKLTSLEVSGIRLRYSQGGITQRQLADEFNMSQGTIGAILRGKIWK